MKTIRENKAREHRIDYGIMVDAYGPEERSMSWYCYLHDSVKFPFQAVCIKSNPVSPLKKGEIVEVIGMPPEKSCEGDMLVMIKFADRTMAVPLSQLDPLKQDKGTKQAIEDWHYWIRMEYQF